MVVTGTIIYIGEVQTISDKFAKREFVVETDEQYPQKILMEFTNQGIEKLNLYKTGDKVEVSINLRGREWIANDGTSRYFITISAWAIRYANGNAPKDFESKQNLEKKDGHWSGLRGDIAQDMMDQALENEFNDDDGLPF